MPKYQLKTPFICDVSEGAGVIPWAEFNPKPYRAIFRASAKFKDGVRREDKRVVSHAAQCRALGIKIGLYHFLRPNNITEQAKLFLSVWNKVGGAEMPPILDVEVILPKKQPGVKFITTEEWAGQVKVWLDLVEAGTGIRPMIYTNQLYWTQTFNRKGKPPVWANKYPLWVAWYPHAEFVDANPVPAPALMPAGFSKWALWQYSQTGIVDGHMAEDLNTISPEYKAILNAQYG